MTSCSLQPRIANERTHARSGQFEPRVAVRVRARSIRIAKAEYDLLEPEMPTDHGSQELARSSSGHGPHRSRCACGREKPDPHALVKLSNRVLAIEAEQERRGVLCEKQRQVATVEVRGGCWLVLF